MKRILFAAVAAVFACSTAQADLVNVAFTSEGADATGSTFTEAGVIGGAGLTWSRIADGFADGDGGSAAGGLITTTSTAIGSGYTFTWNGDLNGHGGGVEANGGGIGPLANSWFIDARANNGVNNTNDAANYVPVELVFGGLGAGSDVDLVLFSTQHSAGVRGTSFDVGGIVQATTGTDNLIGGNGAYTDGGNYTQFSGLTADASGNVTVLATPAAILTSGTAGFSDLNGFQIDVTAVPEPGSAALICLVGAAVAIRRRK